MRPLFISYRRNPWGAEVLRLSAECRRKGLRTIVDVSDPERLAGQTEYDALRRIIREECDGFILYVTRNIVDSACVWDVEVPAALESFDRGSFDFFPLFRDILPSDVATLEPHGRRIAALAGVVVANEDKGVLSAHVELANTALAACIRRCSQRSPKGPITLVIRTRDTGVQEVDADLVVDWTGDYRELLSGEATEDEVLHRVLFDVARAVAAAGIGAVRISGPAHLSAGLALGYTFHRAAGYEVEVAQAGTWWHADGEVTAPKLQIARQQLNPRGSDVLLTLAISRSEIVRDADRAAGVLERHIGGRVVVEPEGGASREAIESVEHARGMVRAIVGALMKARAEWGTRGATHVFMATPFMFAALLGHSLNGFGPLWLYEPRPGHRDYVRTIVLP